MPTHSEKAGAAATARMSPRWRLLISCSRLKIAQTQNIISSNETSLPTTVRCPRPHSSNSCCQYGTTTHDIVELLPMLSVAVAAAVVPIPRIAGREAHAPLSPKQTKLYFLTLSPIASYPPLAPCPMFQPQSLSPFATIITLAARL